jgi:hypothetical protein
MMPIRLARTPVSRLPASTPSATACCQLSGIELVRFGHEPGAESQLDVVDTFAGGIFDVFICDAVTGVIIH